MRLDLDARVVPDERPGVFEVDIDPRATRVDLAPVGMSALAALTAANIMALGLPVGQRTAAQVGRALASQGPFSVPANGVAVIASADRDRLRFTLIDVNDQPLGNGVTVLGNVMLSANARRPEPVVPDAADRVGRGRGFSGFALFS